MCSVCKVAISSQGFFFSFFLVVSDWVFLRGCSGVSLVKAEVAVAAKRLVIVLDKRLERLFAERAKETG